MTSSSRPLRRSALWLVPLAPVVGVVAWQAFARAGDGGTDAAAPVAVPAPGYSLALLPEYQPATLTPPLGNDAVERTLFNPTRRPAPPPTPVQEQAAKPRMKKGQFALAGTLIVDGTVMAFLRESQGGKSRKVRQGENLDGMMVAEIKSDRVRLTLGDETEELMLKVATGPKSTIQPVVPGANRGPVTATAEGQPANSAAPGAPQPRDVADVLAERRRQARAQELAAQGVPPAAAAAAAAQSSGAAAPIQAPTLPPVPQADMGTNDSRWQTLYQRYQQPRR